MKFLIILAIIALASAEKFQLEIPENVKIDHSSVLPIEQSPRYMKNRHIPKQFANAYRRRIVNGWEVVPHSHAYQIVMYITRADGTYICGGSLVGPSSVLTAAHCSEEAQYILVIAGAHDRTANEPSQQHQYMTTSYIHENYNTNNLNNDVSVLIAQAPWNFNSYVTTIALAPAASGNFVNAQATSTGWGATEDGFLSNVMRYSINRVITNAECAAVYGSVAIIDSTLCVESAESNRGICGGDSGGVLSVIQGSTVTQIGITSFTAAAGCALYPSGFARVSSFYNWINNVIQ